MASISSTVTQILLPKKKSNPAGAAYTNTFNPSNVTNTLGLPNYRNHLTDIFTSRQSQDARDLMTDLIKYDSDVSATLHAYLTVADTEPRFYVYNENGELDQPAQKDFQALLGTMTRRNDYTTGYTFSPSLRQVAEDFRYSILLRGSLAAELVFNKLLQPASVRNVDVKTLEWFETAPGVYKPQQRPAGSSTPISLDIANFFVKSYRQNPNEIYTESVFVSAINTIAARQQVINDLYRIMQKTGYPRMDVEVVEEVIRKNAPVDVAKDQASMQQWINNQIGQISSAVAGLRPDSVFVHTDSVKPTILNEGGPAKAFDVTSIIEVLNAQNQAALKTVATFIGRGSAGVNTGSVEARVFSMAADSLNGPIADLFSDMFTLAMRLTGYQGYVVCEFDKAELRPATELEPMKIIQQSRLLELLSLGMIDDNEFHMQMFGRPRPDAAPELSGTGFLAQQSAGVDTSSVSPNQDTLGRSISPAGSAANKSDAVKTPTKQKSSTAKTQKPK